MENQKTQYGLDITSLLKHEQLKKNQDEKVPEYETDYDMEMGAIYTPYINDRNSDIQMWHLSQLVDPINKFNDIVKTSSEPELIEQKKKEEKKSRTAHIDFVKAYLQDPKVSEVKGRLEAYINKNDSDCIPSLKERIKTLLKKAGVEYKTTTGGSKLDFLRRFKNTKNPSKNKKRKKTRRKKVIKRKKHTRRKHLNKSK